MRNLKLDQILIPTLLLVCQTINQELMSHVWVQPEDMVTESINRRSCRQFGAEGNIIVTSLFVFLLISFRIGVV
jgi:hypothetical protein